MHTKDNINCLLIEDDPDLRELILTYCQELEVFRTVATAKDGLEATMKIKNQFFDIIIIDINLPKKNGLKVISDLRRSSDSKKTNIIVMSGDLQPGQLQQATELGIKHFIFKPFTQEKLTAKIKSLIPA